MNGISLGILIGAVGASYFTNKDAKQHLDKIAGKLVEMSKQNTTQHECKCKGDKDGNDSK